MPGEVWQFAASLVAVAAMIALVRCFGFSGAPALAGEAEARSVANGISGGFAATAIEMDSAGHGALLGDASGQIVAVIPHGAHFIARTVAPGATTTVHGGDLKISTAHWEAIFELDPDRAKDWAAAINRLK